MSNVNETSGDPGEREALEALDEIQRMVGGDAAAAERVDPGQLCATYKRIKPLLERALPWIARIPRFGKQVAEAVRFLMSIADNLCPA